MGTDYLNLYLLHWRGSVPLEETVEALEGLNVSGEIRAWGVSNFEPADLRDLRRVPGGEEVATDQVRYHLTWRSIELALLPESQARGLPVVQEVALAWVLRQPGVIIPHSQSLA
ncbi:aldo/keto reductase [Deinococcus sp. DB0503]|uniref:aldo/keto reductase n=1 Tax=Deinococcus sp. DB0503 TaxID=2479203 RepID=UPI0018DFC7CE|nr:aldo/keto reductase [Deinococcus sp. DB0503]